ncbi:hypothetical protein M514_02382 [Trichuris suis]|uniref:Uncharacterized protein n=1 Tax=Trichuris suis TaxID=68888 RepID=A0A085MHL0_9BILA|nr:hypothetical protein M513_02382 [Trichuris suis]KFD60134.1 hypothetical protein M514_02382 [Trichuris suis]
MEEEHLQKKVEFYFTTMKKHCEDDEALPSTSSKSSFTPLARQQRLDLYFTAMKKQCEDDEELPSTSNRTSPATTFPDEGEQPVDLEGYLTSLEEKMMSDLRMYGKRPPSDPVIKPEKIVTWQPSLEASCRGRTLDSFTSASIV